MGERVRSVTRGRVAALAAAALLPVALAVPVAARVGASPAAAPALGLAPAPARTLPAGLSMWGWGTDNDGKLAGQLGNGTTTSSDKPVVVSIPSGDKIRSIAEGCFNGLALTTTGTVLAWGANAAGELGTGSVAPSDVPVPVDLEPGLIPTGVGSGPAAQHGLAIVPGAG
jgi:hypothetical protein